MKTDERFTYSDGQLREFAQTVLDHARALGAAACECDVSEGFGLSVSVRKGEIDTLEHNRDKGIGVSVHFGRRPHVKRGHASTSDFSPAALRQTVEAAVAIARHTAEDDCAGLPDAELLAHDLPDLDLFHPWRISPEEAIDIAKRCESAAFALSPKLRNTEGTSLSAQHSQFIFANSLGFMEGFPTSRHSLGCSMIAEEKGQMQRDDWYSSARVPGTGRRSGGARPLCGRARAGPAAGKEDPHLPGAGAVRSAAGRRPDRAFRVRGERRQPVSQVDVPHRQPGQARCSRRIVSIEERPHEPRAMASSPFDDEGVATREPRDREQRRGRGIFPRHLFGEKARHADHRPAPAATTT